MTLILGVDPGPEMSAMVVISTNPREIDWHEWKANGSMKTECQGVAGDCGIQGVVEKPQPRGTRAGRAMFATVRWAGIFEAALGNALTPLEIGQILTTDSPGTREDAFFGVAHWFRVILPEQIPRWRMLNPHERDALRVAVAWAVKGGAK